MTDCSATSLMFRKCLRYSQPSTISQPIPMRTFIYNEIDSMLCATAERGGNSTEAAAKPLAKLATRDYGVYDT